MKKCPDCQGVINYTQNYCPHCSSDLFKKPTKIKKINFLTIINKFILSLVNR